MNKNIKRINTKTLSITLLPIFLFLLYFFVNPANAQNAISLSITPPLFEVMIQPGKEVKQIYSIGNDGGDTIVVPKIVYFEPSDDGGNINLTEDSAPEWVKYNPEPIKIKSGAKTDFNVLFSPPKDVEEIDHFLTLIFESSVPVDVLNQNAVNYQSQIGTNILLTISKDGNPKKSAEIVEFIAPYVVDSLFNKINYSVVLKNNGNSFWKPNGKITTTNDESLKLASQNILSGSKRNVLCLQEETLIECGLKNKFMIGKITSKLEFSLDDSTKIYKNEITTIAFPFSIIGILIALLTLFRLKGILNVWQKRR